MMQLKMYGTPAENGDVSTRDPGGGYGRGNVEMPLGHTRRVDEQKEKRIKIEDDFLILVAGWLINENN